MKTVKTLLFTAFLLLVGIMALQTSNARGAQSGAQGTQPPALLQATCSGCHNATTVAGGLDLQALPYDLSSAATRAPWIQIYDRIEKREMPPNPASLSEENRQALLRSLGKALNAAERADIVANGINRRARVPMPGELLIAMQPPK